MSINVRTQKVYEIPIDKFKEAFDIKENTIYSINITESGEDVLVHTE
jgi:hypothetical protein